MGHTVAAFGAAAAVQGSRVVQLVVPCAQTVRENATHGRPAAGGVTVAWPRTALSALAVTLGLLHAGGWSGRQDDLAQGAPQAGCAWQAHGSGSQPASSQAASAAGGHMQQRLAAQCAAAAAPCWPAPPPLTARAGWQSRWRQTAEQWSCCLRPVPTRHSLCLLPGRRQGKPWPGRAGRRLAGSWASRGRRGLVWGTPPGQTAHMACPEQVG